MHTSFAQTSFPLALKCFYKYKIDNAYAFRIRIDFYNIVGQFYKDT